MRLRHRTSHIVVLCFSFALASLVLQTSSRPSDPKSTKTPAGLSSRINDTRITKKKPARTFVEPETLCGRVPIYQERIGVSINESFEVKTGDEDDFGGDFRILHGLEAEPGEWPWIAKIDLCPDPDACGSCTGSLINARWLITAGHCGGSTPDKYRATFGLNDLLIDEKTTVEVEFDKVITHPNFDINQLNDDITLLRLSKPLRYGYYIQPVCLVDMHHKDAVKFAKDRKCYNVGYGLTADLSAALKLQKLEVVSLDTQECSKDSPELNVSEGDVCIAPREGIGASCRGDSGGPNTCFDPHTNQWYLYSTVSHGPQKCDRDEGDRWLTVSTGIAAHLSWIEKTIRDNSS